MRKVVIIGAPRSGTNMLRDLLCSVEGVETWPCDEINYIWRHGNVRYPSDEFPPVLATPRVQSYINKKFYSLAEKTKANIIVEKTCANALRVGFVETVLHDPLYVVIERDGVDAAASAAKRWGASLEPKYLFEKARFVPISDLPYYATRYLYNRLYRLFSGKKRLASWGPTLDNMREIVGSYSLEEVCALQWQACVGNSRRDLESIDEARVLRVRYESLVTEKYSEIERLGRFLGVSPETMASQPFVEQISSTSIGKGRTQLGSGKVARIERLVGGTLKELGYL